MPDHDDKPDTKQEPCEPPPEIAGHAAKHPPGGAPDQLIDPDVEPVEPTPEARRMVARFEEIKRTPRPVKLLLHCCRALKDVLQEYTDERLLVLGIPPFGDDGPKLGAGALRQLHRLLGPRYRVVEVGDTAAIHAKLSPEQAREQARELADGMRGAGGQIKVITPTTGGPPLGRPTPLDATTGEPMTPERVREIIAYLKGIGVAETEPYLGYSLQTPRTQNDKLTTNARRVLLWLLDGPGQLPVAEPCEHRSTVDLGTDPATVWCSDCGAVHHDGEWRLPGTVDDA